MPMNGFRLKVQERGSQYTAHERIAGLHTTFGDNASNTSRCGA